MKSITSAIAGTLVCAMFALAGCGGKAPAPNKTPISPAKKIKEGTPPQTIVISAASSTKDALEKLTEKFREKSGLEVVVNAGPSSGLAQQIISGAPADLFLSASREWADEIAKKDLAVASRDLLTNKLVLVVPKGNPANIKTPEDLASVEVKRVALAGEQVPAGKYADQALGKLGLRDKLTSEGKLARGQDVRSALAYVERGEAEAGIVYSTDARTTEGVEVVHEFGPDLHDEIVYVLVLVKPGGESQGAREFFDFLASPESREVFKTFGFLTIEAR